jgi:hypothetical protein
MIAFVLLLLLRLVQFKRRPLDGGTNLLCAIAQSRNRAIFQPFNPYNAIILRLFSVLFF